MTPVETILAIRRAGGDIEVRGDRLALRAPEPLPGDVVAAAREHRDALLRMLTLKKSELCRICGRSAWWQRPDGGWVCGVCHPDPQVLLAEWRVSSGQSNPKQA